MEILEWIIFLFQVDVESANLETILWEEFIEMTFDLETKSLYTFQGIEYFWMN